MATVSDIQDQITLAEATYEAMEKAYMEAPGPDTERDLEIAWHERKFALSEVEIYDQW